MNRPHSSPKNTMLVVDDHAIVCEGLRRVLEPLSGEWRILEAPNAFVALDLMRQQTIDLAIVDLSMPGMNGLDLVRRIKALYPHMPALVMSMYNEQQYARRAFKAGASGYLTKDSAAGELVTAVRKVLAGGAYVSADLAERMAQELSGKARRFQTDALSDREIDVLRRIVAGQRLTEIAQALHLSIKTVSTHKSRIQDKLQLPNIAALVRFGLEHGLDKNDSAFSEIGESPVSETSRLD